MKEEIKKMKSYRTLWKMHIWGYTGDKYVFTVSSILILAGIIFGFTIGVSFGLFIGFFGVLFMGYHLQQSVYWWKRENRIFDYAISQAPRLIPPYPHKETEEEECSECGETACEWLEYNEGVCCNDNRDLEYPKFCPPCAEDKTADMIDTAMDLEKDKDVLK